MAGQYAGEKDPECAPATAAAAAVRTEDPLSAGPLRIGTVWIVAQQATMAIQRPAHVAVGAALLLERKSSAFNAGSSATKRMHAGGIRPYCPKWSPQAELFPTALQTA